MNVLHTSQTSEEPPVLDAEVAGEGAPPSVSIRRYLPDILAAFACSMIALVSAIWSTGARPANLGLLWHRDDLIPYYAAAKGMIENGWWTPNPDLGFPYVQDTSAFPTPDFIAFAAIKLATVWTNDAFAAVNLYFLLSFPAVALAGFLLLRSARVSIVISAILATSFALLPWHFERLQHLFLANYSFMALGLILVGLAARGSPDRDIEKRKRAALLAAIVVAGVLVGLGGVYYAAFTTMLGGLVLALQFIAGRSLRKSTLSMLTLLVVPFTTAVALVYIKLTATSEATSGIVRETRESLVYGGDLYSLFRVGGDSFGSSLFAERLRELKPLLPIPVREGDAQLNLVAVIAVVVATLILGLGLASLGGRYQRGTTLIRGTGPWILMFVVSLFMFATGGFGAIFSAYLGASIRAWGRMSIGVAAIAFVIFGITLTIWWASRRWRTVCIIVVALIGTVTILDPLLAPSRISFVQGKSLQENLVPYIAAAESVLPANCPVLEVPIGLYPEVKPAERQRYYEDLLPYLYSSDLRWSYGAMQYTAEGRWAKENLDVDPAQQVVLAKRAGFCAVQLDMNGFKPESAEGVRSTYTKLLGPPIAQTANNRWVMFSLSGA